MADQKTTASSVNQWDFLKEPINESKLKLLFIYVWNEWFHEREKQKFEFQTFAKQICHILGCQCAQYVCVWKTTHEWDLQN